VNFSLLLLKPDWIYILWFLKKTLLVVGLNYIYSESNMDWIACVMLIQDQERIQNSGSGADSKFAKQDWIYYGLQPMKVVFKVGGILKGKGPIKTQGL